MKKITSTIGKALLVMGAICLISECDTPSTSIISSIIALASIGIGYLLCREDLAKGDNRA